MDRTVKTRNEAARILMNTFQQIFDLYERALRLCCRPGTSDFDNVPCSWFYPYRKVPGFITVVLQALGSRSAIHKALRYEDMSSSDLQRQIDDHKSEIIDAFKKRQQAVLSRKQGVTHTICVTKNLVSGTFRCSKAASERVMSFHEIEKRLNEDVKKCDPQVVKELYNMLPTESHPIKNYKGLIQRVEHCRAFDLALYAPPESGVEEFLQKKGVPYLKITDLVRTRKHAPVIISEHPCVVHFAKRAIAIMPQKGEFERRMRKHYPPDLVPAIYDGFTHMLNLYSDVRFTNAQASEILSGTCHVPWVC